MFPITVGRLVQIHEIHVDSGPGDIAIVLSVQMQQGLPQRFQSVDPHFGRREGVTPGEQPNAVGRRIRLLKQRRRFFWSLDH